MPFFIKALNKMKISKKHQEFLNEINKYAIYITQKAEKATTYTELNNILNEKTKMNDHFKILYEDELTEISIIFDELDGNTSS